MGATSKRIDYLRDECSRMRIAARARDLEAHEAERLRNLEAEIDRLEAREMAGDFVRLEAIVERQEAAAARIERAVEKLEASDG